MKPPRASEHWSSTGSSARHQATRTSRAAATRTSWVNTGQLAKFVTCLRGESTSLLHAEALLLRAEALQRLPAEAARSSTARAAQAGRLVRAWCQQALDEAEPLAGAHHPMVRHLKELLQREEPDAEEPQRSAKRKRSAIGGWRVRAVAERSERSGSGEGRRNVTRVGRSSVQRGILHDFRPEVLPSTASFALVLLFLEAGLAKMGFYVVGSAVPFLEIMANCSYKYVQAW
eukprot:g17203.t1